jgi:biotin carboxyl carrier protein
VEWNISDGAMEHHVTLRREGSDFHIQLNDKHYSARVLHHAPPRLTLLVDNRHVVETDVEWRDGDCSLNIDNIPYAFHAIDPLATAIAGGGGVVGSASNIVAPLPGRVIEIFATKGDTVKKGQPVCIIEAMKMQNEICAPTDGTVSDIQVTPGDTVDNGTLLMKL